MPLRGLMMMMIMMMMATTVGRVGTESWVPPPQVMGSLADQKCVQGQRVSGILVKKNFNYHILTPSDLSSEFCCSEILHKKYIT